MKPFALSDFVKPARQRKPRALGTSGRTLETLVESSQTTVALTRVKSAIKYLRGGEKVPVKSSCDFFGCFKSDGRLLVLDCKESNDPNRLCTDPDHLPEHQRLELLRYADAGAVAGVLALRKFTNELYWFPAGWLHPRSASLLWGDAWYVGSAGAAVDWQRLRQVDAVCRPSASAVSATPPEGRGQAK